MTGLKIKHFLTAIADKEFQSNFFTTEEEKKVLCDFLLDDCFLCGLGPLLRTILDNDDKKIISYFGSEYVFWLEQYRKRQKEVLDGMVKSV